MAKSDTYSQSGVDYSKLDPSKVSAQQAAASTSGYLKGFGFEEIATSRGESAYVWDQGESYGAFVVEGLGTKNMIADVAREFTGKTHYDSLAQDTIAMIVNDLVVVGAVPTVINAYWAVGASEWHDDQERVADLVSGWKEACEKSGATWGGGETPTLKGVINPQGNDLAGAAIGIIQNKDNLVLGENMRPGDRIILVESSGVHANGITLIRSLAEKDPDLYKRTLNNGRTFADALLSPTHLYVELVKRLQKKQTKISYMVNITGHGWRKLMRGPKDFTYRMNYTPEVPEEFEVIAKESKSTPEDMYGNYNMGAGFAIFVPQSEVDTVLTVCKELDFAAWDAGVVEEGKKQVVIEPLDLTFAGDSLGVRG